MAKKVAVIMGSDSDLPVVKAHWNSWMHSKSLMRFM